MSDADQSGETGDNLPIAPVVAQESRAPCAMGQLSPITLAAAQTDTRALPCRTTPGSLALAGALVRPRCFLNRSSS